MVLAEKAKNIAKKAAIRAGLEASAALQSLGLGNRAAGRGIIFTLHRVEPGEQAAFSPNAHLSIEPGFLEAAILALRKMEYRFVRLEDVPSLLAENTVERFACFTLDDGYRNNAHYAAPIFSRYDVPFTIFVAKGFSERTHSLWWETLSELIHRHEEVSIDLGHGPHLLPLKTLAEKDLGFRKIARFINEGDETSAVEKLDKAALALGLDPLLLTRDLIMDAHELRELGNNTLVSYGAHTISHRGLARLPLPDAVAEIDGSATYLENVVGIRPSTFAYPYGDARSVSKRESDILKEAGIAIAVTTRPATLTSGHLNALTTLPRVSLNGLYQKTRYVRALASGLPFQLTGG